MKVWETKQRDGLHGNRGRSHYTVEDVLLLQPSLPQGQAYIDLLHYTFTAWASILHLPLIRKVPDWDLSHHCSLGWGFPLFFSVASAPFPIRCAVLKRGYWQLDMWTAITRGTYSVGTAFHELERAEGKAVVAYFMVLRRHSLRGIEKGTGILTQFRCVFAWSTLSLLSTLIVTVSVMRQTS
jgi:hypothetical protein